jgi:hypothetical protein
MKVSVKEAKDEMNLLMDSEKNNYFLYVIYDASDFNQMGISSSQYGYDDIKKTLGIV